jgi:uncharacterized protein DUF2721
VTAEAITRTIQLVLAPVVMVSACSIFVGGLLSRYTNLSDRMRAMTSERLDLPRRVSAAEHDSDVLKAERLREIDVELPDLAHRHRLLHHAVLAMYVAILILVACMCLTAVSALVPADWIMGLVLVLFVCGVLAMLPGVALVALEVRTSQRALQFEVHRVLGLGVE